MTGETYAEQLVKTKELGLEEHNYFGILAFGKIDKINPITKRLSLGKRNFFEKHLKISKNYIINKCLENF